MQMANLQQKILQPSHQDLWEQRQLVLAAFAIPHRELQRQIPLQQIAIHKQQGRKGLVLGGGTQLKSCRQVAQESVHLEATPIPGWRMGW